MSAIVCNYSCDQHFTAKGCCKITEDAPMVSPEDELNLAQSTLAHAEQLELLDAHQYGAAFAAVKMIDYITEHVIPVGDEAFLPSLEAFDTARRTLDAKLREYEDKHLTDLLLEGARKRREARATTTINKKRE